jgi:apolipoprotein N-acyltransferase
MPLKILLALVAGAMLPLAFAPFYFYPLAILAPALLCYCWLEAKPRQAFTYGWIYGLAAFGVGVSWVYVSMYRFGGMAFPLACLFTLLFVMVLALFPAAQGYLLQRYFPQRAWSKLLLAFPISMALNDWLRSWLFSGFPWLLLGHSQTNSPLRGFAPLLGEYGLDFVLCLCSALLLWSYLQFKTDKSRPIYFLPLAALAAICLLGHGLTRINWTHTAGSSINVSLVQGNIPQQLKWQPEFLQPTLTRYLELTQPHWHSDLIIWPEGAVPITYQTAQGFMQHLSQQAKKYRAQLLVGIPEEADDSHFFNALYLLGDKQGHYYKRQLVPFGEYLPFPRLLSWLLDLWQIPISTMLPGAIQQNALQMTNFSLAPFICYEIAYAKLVESIPAAIDFLVVVSNDAWFGESFAPAQHLQIVQFRALSTQRPALVSTNTGITAIIDAEGRIEKQLVQDTAAVLTGEIVGRQGRTPIMVIHSELIIGCLVLLLIVAYRLRNFGFNLSHQTLKKIYKQAIN